MIQRLFTIAVVSVLALACTTTNTSDPMAPASNERTIYSGVEVGPTPVGSIPDIPLRDNERNRDLQLTIDYPTRGGPHPLIFISPGFGGSHRGYVGLASYWAANNYVVVRVNHGDRTMNVQTAEDIWANATPADWRNRVRDLTFVLDSIGTLTQRYPELEGKIDLTKVGVAGHSYGAHTAMLVAGARTFPGGVSYADPRIKAIVVMSPQGPSETRGLTSESFTELRVPALFMTGTRDQGITDAETPEWRAEAFRLAPAGDKWLVTVEGAGHTTFAGGGPASIEQIARERSEAERTRIPDMPDPTDPEDVLRPGGRRRPDEPIETRTGSARGTRAERQMLRQRELFAIVRGVALSFFDTYLRGDATARTALEKMSERRAVTVERK